MVRFAAITAGVVLGTAGLAAAAIPAKPVVATGAAKAITYQSAGLTGTVNPEGKPTVYFFQIGTSTRYGGQSAPVSLAGGKTAVAAGGPVGGLKPVTKYFYRLVAVSAGGTTLGGAKSFTTPKIPLSVGITGVPNPIVYGAPLTVSGTVSGTGAGSRDVILQANPYPFTTGFVNVGNAVVTTPTGSFGFNLLALPVTTQFRVVSTGGGQAVGSPVTTEYVALAVTTRVTRHRTKPGSYTIGFAGQIAPAEVGARVGVERLVGRTWKFVKGGNATAATPGSSSYSATIRAHHGGFYRVRVLPVEGGHVTGYGPATLVRLAGVVS
ncbi:MAG TPA: hypothetical protein VG165_09335 [Solirubrobacteraceae bacterium]|jgi:hypothetical protein|nr:hypothetical protein [Solirubrobacteraceae bacterium]